MKKYTLFTLAFVLTILAIQTTQGAIYQTIGRVKADSIIHANIGDTNFVIIDVRTPYEYNGGHIKCAININYYASNFGTDIDKLDKNKTYLIYCATGSRSAVTLIQMQNKSFQEVYNLSGGINKWTPYGYPVYGNAVKYHYEDINLYMADTLITANVANKDFVIIDLRSPGEYAVAHIKDAVNIDYKSKSFTTTIGNLDSSKTYLIYCADGTYSDTTLILMYDLDFWTVYNMYEGFNQWALSGYPVDSMGVGIAEVYNKDIDYTIYPNPSTGLFNLEISNNDKEALELEIINAEGQIVFNKQVNNSVIERIDLGNHPKGLYFIKIIGEGSVCIEKLIIQ